LSSLEIISPDDWHVHLRDDEALSVVAPWTAKYFSRAIVMPNLKNPIITTAQALSYAERIKKATVATPGFTPLMTLFLNQKTDPGDLESGLRSQVVVAAKLYPANVTTNSAEGVADIESIYPCLEVLSQTGRPLLVHAEDPSPMVDVFDREQAYLTGTMTKILKDFPQLKVVIEHITTKEAVAFVRRNQPRVAATITAHHLTLNRNSMFDGGLRPHFYCLPVLKREEHRLALIEAATSGEACFFLGTDSAPHAKSAKENSCGCAGIFSSPTALSHYLSVFKDAGRLDQFETFASINGPRFYELPVNQGKVRFKETTWLAPEWLKATPAGDIRIFGGGEDMRWQLESSS
jgi:dihydroorotase